MLKAFHAWAESAQWATGIWVASSCMAPECWSAAAFPSLSTTSRIDASCAVCVPLGLKNCFAQGAHEVAHAAAVGAQPFAQRGKALQLGR